MTTDLHERVAVLEHDVKGQSRDDPGLIMRMDRVELVMKLGAIMGLCGVAWKVCEVVLQLSALKVTHTP